MFLRSLLVRDVWTGDFPREDQQVESSGFGAVIRASSLRSNVHYFGLDRISVRDLIVKRRSYTLIRSEWGLV